MNRPQLPPDPLAEALRAWADLESRQPVRTTPALLRLKAELARMEEARAREGRVAGTALALAALVLLGGTLGLGLRPPADAGLPMLLPLCLLGASGLALGRFLRC